jgi:transposase
MEKKEGYGQKKHPGKYPPEIREQAVEMYNRCRSDFTSNDGTARHVAQLLGIGCFDTVLSWVRQAGIDSGIRPGVTTDEQEEIRRLRRENAELKRANGILRAASAFFAAELDRPQNK